MLFQVIGNQFLVVKKTWPSMLILTFGALVNIVLNFWLIPTLGIEGASIAVKDALDCPKNSFLNCQLF